MMHYTDLPNGIKAYLHNRTIVRTSLFEAIRASMTRWIWKTSYKLCCRLNGVPRDYDFNLVDLSVILGFQAEQIQRLQSSVKRLTEMNQLDNINTSQSREQQEKIK